MKAIGWAGAVCMMCASFLMSTWYGLAIAICGLSLLTVQASHAKLWNLVTLNIVSICGFLFSLYLLTA